MEPKKPSFLIVGAARCGTTSLYDLLTSHPACEAASTKEVHYFDLNYERGWQWYLQQFPSGVVTGEASPYYLYDPRCAKRIAENLPEALIVALLRNPADRAYSHYALQRSLGYESRTFEQAVEEEEKWIAGEIARHGEAFYEMTEARIRSYLTRGFYADQIARYLEYFSRDKVMIFGSELYYKQPLAVASEILAKLGIGSASLNPVPFVRSQYAGDMSIATRSRLEAIFKPHNSRLASLLSHDFGWD